MFSFKRWCKKHDDKIRAASGVSSAAWSAFKERKRLLIEMSVLSVGLTLVSLGIVGTQLFYPYHVFVGVGIYVLSFIPLIYRIYLSRSTWMKYKSVGLAGAFLKNEHRKILVIILVFVVTAVLLWVRPAGNNLFNGMSDNDISTLVSDDLYRSVTAMDYLETTGNDLLSELNAENEGSNTTENINKAFDEFTKAVIYSESLTDKHRYFDDIPYSMWDERLTSFLISYSLYAKKYELVHKIAMSVSGDEYKKKSLNHYNNDLQREGVYLEMINRFYLPETRVRLSAGFLYGNLFIGDTDRDDDSFILLRDKSYGSYAYLKDNIGETIAEAPEVIVDRVESDMFETWFPLQKEIASTMGEIIISTRGNNGLIKESDIEVMEGGMQPGDIMLQRRNWHVSNVGIPGFWTHSALYTGDLDSMDMYFDSEFPFKGYESVSEYLKSELPEVYTELTSQDLSQKYPSVIEAVSAGVVLHTLKKSADADFVVVLRPSLSKSDKLQALIKAFENFGKPYDFNFDFDTRDVLACSELVYDAYFEKLPDKAGLHMSTSLINGRKMVTPLSMAEKYVREEKGSNQEMEFVYFLMSDEDTKTVSVGDKNDFTESVEWSKFSFLQ